MAGPLEGIRVLDLTRVLAGPYATMVLGDLGAEVIKLEQPGAGDEARNFGPFKNGFSLYFMSVNRGKKSLTLDLKAPQGKEIFMDLVKQSDILVENFRPGTMERWNLGWDELSAINPRLIMIRVSGYGQTGPYAARAGYGAIGEAMGGLRYVVGDPSTPPSRIGISMGDTLAATFAALGALIALHNVHRTGRGQVVDSAIYEAVLGVMESLITDFDQGDYIRERTGAILHNIAPSNVYPTKDGKMILIAANQDTVFRRLADAMGRAELSDDPRYAGHSARGDRQAELDDLIAGWTRTLDSGPLEATLHDHGVPAGNIYRAPEMLEDAHFKAREAIVRVADHTFGEIAMQNVAPKLSETPGEVRHAAPLLGEHNDEIYRGLLELGEAELVALKDADII